MPKTYPPEAKKTAFELYLTGMSLDEVIKRMRTEHGFATYSRDTLLRWREQGNWDMVREKLGGQAAQRKLDTSLDDLRESLLEDLKGYQAKIKAALEDENQAENFTENMSLMLRVHGLLEKAVAQRDGEVQVDKPRMWLEFFSDFMADLRQKDPRLFNQVAEHADYFKARFKERHEEEAA